MCLSQIKLAFHSCRGVDECLPISKRIKSFSSSISIGTPRPIYSVTRRENGLTRIARPFGRRMTADLVGSERVRRHPHHRACSALQCGFSRGPRAYRVRVPISGRADREHGQAIWHASCCRTLQLSDLLELGENLPMMLREVSDHARITEHRSQKSLGEYQIEMVNPI
jgi:hypothetical protein